MSTNESTPTVGRWLLNDPDGWWECDGSAPARCVRLHGPSVSACRACGTKRPPMPETPRVGRWVLPRRTWWQCECGATLAAAYAKCPDCGTARPPLPETPAPMTVTGTVTATIVNADGAQVVGKEPIAGVDDALCVCGHAASAHSCNGGVGDAECGCESFAALRAVPVEGGEPRVWQALKDGSHWDFFPDCSRAEAEEMLQEYASHWPTATFAVIPLYAHPAPDARDA